ncbi:MAG: hypothetical protein M1823_007633, partial [Watsoniomyces obsoletus]
MPKRKRSSAVDVEDPKVSSTPNLPVPPPSRAPPSIQQGRESARPPAQIPPPQVDTNPDTNGLIRDGQDALRASPDSAARDLHHPSKRARSKKSTAPATPKTSIKGDPDEPPSLRTTFVMTTPPPKKVISAQVNTGQ